MEKVKRIRTKEGPNSNTKVGQSSQTRGKVVLILVDVGQGSEHQIQVAVDNGHVQSENEDDGRCEEHLQGANQGALDELMGGNLRIQA